MNASQRRSDRRQKDLVRLGRGAAGDRERADAAELELALARDRVAELEAQLAASEAGRAKLAEEAAEWIEVASDRRVDLDQTRLVAHERAERIDAQEREIAKLRAQDHDAAKLRRRLQERGAELELAQRRIHELEERLRAAAPVLPAIHYRSRGA